MGTGPAEAEPARLSPRELEVARLVSQGLTNREIAARLFISERTVDGHLERVREKLEVNNRAQITAWVVRQATAGAVPAKADAPAPKRRPRVWWPAWVAAALVLAIVAAAVLVRLNQPSGPVITTFAGAGSPPQAAYPGGGFSGDDGPAIHALMSRPSDIAITKDGAMYIADYANSLIRRVNTSGIISTVAGGGAHPLKSPSIATDIQLTFAGAVAVGPGSDRLYVLTVDGPDLEVWSLRGSVLYFEVSLGPSRTPREFGLPIGGIVVAKDGAMYIADRAENRVWKWTGSGNPSVFAGTGESGASGNGAAATGAQLNWPVGLALDPTSGDLYIADSGNNCIRKVDASQRITSVAGVCGALSDDSGDGGQATKALLSFPFGVAVGTGGATYIADTGNNQIRKVIGGVITVVAGTGATGLSGDGGQALEAALAGPFAVKIDSRTKDLFVVDTGNHRIRRVSGHLA